MNTDAQTNVDKEDRPLTRADVERLLHEIGSSDKLNLRGRNLQMINLTSFRLAGANLREVDLREANLTEADLTRADLGGANLMGADLREANLTEADLTRADLTRADLGGANLMGANLSGAIGLDVENEKVENRGLVGRVRIAAKGEVEDMASALSIRITEEPLTAQNFSTIISVLTELYTKAWLIQQGRFPDLINYAQTHDRRFTKEANLVIGKLAHDSPALIELLLNPATLAATATVALALKTAIDAVAQTRLRFRAMELDNQKKALEMKI